MQAGVSHAMLSVLVTHRAGSAAIRAADDGRLPADGRADLGDMCCGVLVSVRAQAGTSAAAWCSSRSWSCERFAGL